MSKVYPARSCPICSVEFHHYDLRKKYCSMECYRKSQFGETNAKFRGGTSIQTDGYRAVQMNKRRKRQHIWVMEQYIGRELLPGEVVHHKDENRANNDISNLELLSSQSEHARMHAQTRTKPPRIKCVRLFKDATSKQCTFCLEIKDRSLFGVNPHIRQHPNEDANWNRCKACVCAVANERRRK